MKMKFLKIGVCMLGACLLINTVDAQRASRKRGTTTPATTGGNEQQQQNNNNQQPVNYDPYANLPIEYDTASADNAGGKSLRNDDAFDKSSLNSRTPLVYENLRWDDALYSEKVWRELDLREKMNKIFQHDAIDENGKSQMFVNILMNAVRSGEVTAFTDDRFSTPMAPGEIDQLTAGKVDTFAKYDPQKIDKVIGYVVTRASFDPKLVNKIRLKEQWIFDRESSRMFCRILGIGIFKTEYYPNTTKERGVSPLFWVYYPDMRPTLVKLEVYNPKNMGQNRMTWEELFESRMFSSYIVKSTLDNPSNKMIKNYIKDPILALLEGDNIKEKIFNFEQDLWSY